MSARHAPVLVLVPPRWIGGLGVMRSLGRLGIPVYGLAHRSTSIPNVSRYAAGFVNAGDDGRPIGGDPGRVVDDLLRAADRLGDGTILIAGTDEWATFVAEHADALATRFRFPRTPVAVVEALASKEGLARLAFQHGLPTPGIAVPASAADAARLARTLTYPILVKPVHSRPDVTYKGIASDEASMLRHYQVLEERPEAPNVLLQEYIPGEDADVWMFNGYFDASSRCLAAFTGVKLRQHPARMGHCAMGELRQNEVVIDQTISFLQAVAYQGIVDIGFRFDARDGRYKVLDVNPRLGGAFRLFVDRNGVDVARAMYWDFTGTTVPGIEARDGRRWFREDSDLVAFRHYRRDHGLTMRNWLSSYRGVEESSTFAWTDPLPFASSMFLLARDTLVDHIPGRRKASVEPIAAPAVPETSEVATG
ncbi:MAG TPA: ATP-grasp domain-containing protein [Candidatus Dormibacteraeota bacterium]|nr:ATP-grasp domain-containing protein [Candidatus Dormibacteraeota bacterium]